MTAREIKTCMNYYLASFKASLFAALFLFVLKNLISRQNHVHNPSGGSKCIDAANTYYSNSFSNASCSNNSLFNRKTFASKNKNTRNKQCVIHQDSYCIVLSNTPNRKRNLYEIVHSLLEDKSSFLFLYLHNDDSTWYHFVGEGVPISYTGTQESKINESGNIYVFHASFIGLHSDGSIRIKNSNTSNVLISESFFSSSYSNEDGGSIYVGGGSFYVNGSSCIQYRICSVNSTIPNNPYVYGCHSRVREIEKSYIIQSSLSKSAGYGGCIDLQDGSQLIDSTNISYAKCVMNAAYACIYDLSSHRINFTSIFNNTADQECVMRHSGINQSVSHCNVIKNIHNRIKWDLGIVLSFCDNLLEFSFCVFTSNSGPFLFYIFDINGRIVVDQCFLENNNVTETAPKNSSVSLNATSQLVLNLRHLSTQECETKLSLIEKKTSKVENLYKKQRNFRRKRR